MRVFLLLMQEYPGLQGSSQRAVVLDSPISTWSASENNLINHFPVHFLQLLPPLTYSLSHVGA